MYRKFHKSRDGVFRVCKANSKPCPLPHVEANNAAEAWARLEKAGEGLNTIKSPLKKKTWSKAKAYRANTLNPSISVTEQNDFNKLQKDALAAVKEGKFAVVTRQHHIELYIPDEETFRDPDWSDEEDYYSEEEINEMTYDKQMEYMESSFSEKNIFETLPSDVKTVHTSNEIQIFDSREEFEKLKNDPSKALNSQYFHFEYDRPNNDGWVTSQMDFDTIQPGLASQEELYFYE